MNSTSYDIRMNDVAVGIFIGLEIISILILVLNCLALRVFLKRRFWAKKTTYLIVSLTVADSLVGFAVAVTICFMAGSYEMIFINRKPVLVAFSSALSFLMLFSLNLSLNCLCSIAMERLIAVLYPFRLRVATSRQYLTVIAVNCILAFIIPTFDLLIQEKLLSKSVIVAILYVQVCLQLLIILSSYLCIWMKLKFFPEVTDRSRTARENKRMTKTLLMVTAICIMAWLPKVILGLLEQNGLYNYIDQPWYTHIAHFLIMLNSLINVAIYSFRIPDFFNELKKIFSCVHHH